MKLEDMSFEILAQAIKTLRPKLNRFFVRAARHEWIYFENSENYGPKLKLQIMDRQEIVDESLDSDVLFTCFENC